MGLSDQTPEIQGATDGTSIGNVGDSLKTAIQDGSGNALSSTGGSLNVNITGGAGSGGTAQADKSTFTEGTTQFTPVGGVYNETISSDPTEDQAAAARITAKRAVHTNLRNNSGTEIATASNPVRIDPTGSTAQPVTDNGGSLTVDGTVAATQSGTWTTNQGGAALPSNAWYVRITDGASTAGITNFSLNSNITNASGASAVNIQDGGNSITVDGTVAATQSGTWNINNISGTVSLPTGASTSANQTTANGSLSSIDTKLTTTNSSLASIDAGIPTALGQTTMAASMPVAIASNQTAIPVTDNGGSLTIDGTVTANAGTGNFNNASVGTNNAAIPTSSTLIGGNDGTNIVPIGAVISTPSLSSVGLVTRNLPYEPQTYSTTSTSFTAANTATDIFTITGSGTKTIRVQKILITATRTTATNADILLIKRSTANSGGTSTTRTAVPHDSTNSAATAVVRSYTANPTVGTAVGTLKCYKFMVGTVTPGNAQSQPGMTEVCWEFNSNEGQPIYLRGTSEVLAVNLNSVTWAGNSFCIDIEWTEV